MTSYEEMLSRAMSKVPAKSKEGSRFVIPKAISDIEGNQTLLKNIDEVSSALRRDPQHIIKFLSLELATSAELSGGRVVFLGKFRNEQVQNKLNSYVKEFVLCNECGKPDTHFEKRDKFTHLKCEACGAERILRKIKGQ
jgi:translation initiation factor 2 subunit 2